MTQFTYYKLILIMLITVSTSVAQSSSATETVTLDNSSVSLIKESSSSEQIVTTPRPQNRPPIVPATVVEPTTINVAVLPFTSTVLNGDELNAVTLKFMSELNSMKKYAVMERGLMNEILAEQGFQQSGACDEEGCAVEIGRLIAVDKIVAGSVSKIGNVLILNVQVINLETGKNDLIINREYDGPMSFFISELVPQAAAEISGVKQVEKKVDLGNKGDTQLYQSVKNFLKEKDNRIAFGRYLESGGGNLVFKIQMGRSRNITYTNHMQSIIEKAVTEQTSGVIGLPNYAGPTFLIDATYGKDRAKNSIGYQFTLVKDGVISKKQYAGALSDISETHFHTTEKLFTTKNQLILSGVIPGAPQLYQERLGKALTIGGLFWGSVAAAVTLHIKHTEAYDNYESFVPTQGNIVTPKELTQLNKDYDTSEEMLTYRNYAIAGAGVMYLIGLFDTYLYTDEVNTYNRLRWRVDPKAKRFVLEGDF